MRIDVLTLFPGIFTGPLDESILKIAQDKELLSVYVHDLRRFTDDKHNTADDYSFGGGAGMVMKPEPIFKGIEAVKKLNPEENEGRIILMTPQGRTFDQETALDFSREESLIFICGRYEGVDERVRENLVTDELSIGDYVLTGGELPALVVIDAVSRMIPGVIGEEDSFRQDSFFNDRLDYPHYTRPRSFRKMKVPEILLSGNHQKIAEWRKKQSLKRTLKRRPDLLKKKEPDAEEKKIIYKIKDETAAEGED